MVFDQGDNEVAGDQTNDAASHVNDRNGAEAHLAYLNQAIDLANTLNDLDLLWLLIEQLFHANRAVRFRHVIPEQRHLFHADCIVVEATID